MFSHQIVCQVSCFAKLKVVGKRNKTGENFGKADLKK